MTSPAKSSNPDRRVFPKGAGIAAAAGIGGAVAPEQFKRSIP